MSLNYSNPQITATYGVGSGNAPALSICSVGHLIVAFFKLLKTYSYEQTTEIGEPCSPQKWRRL